MSRFIAKIELKNLKKPIKATILGSADGPLGSSRGSGTFELIEISNGTNLKYNYEIELSGTIAAVGGRLIRGASRQLIEIFLRALARQAGDIQGIGFFNSNFWLKLKQTLGFMR